MPYFESVDSDSQRNPDFRYHPKLRFLVWWCSARRAVSRFRARWWIGLPLLCVALFLTVGIGPAEGFGAKLKITRLLNGEDFSATWLHFPADHALAETWRVEKQATGDPELVCLGKPFGYIRTRQLYEKFEFSMEWMYPTNSPNGNSGVLIHTTGADKIWPKAIQVQLHRPTAGSIFPSGGAMTKNTVTVKDLKLPVNQWHKCVITCRDGTVSVLINGKKAGEVTGCDPKQGCIALQSQGSEMRFRRLMVRKL